MISIIVKVKNDLHVPITNRKRYHMIRTNGWLVSIFNDVELRSLISHVWSDKGIGVSWKKKIFKYLLIKKSISNEALFFSVVK